MQNKPIGFLCGRPVYDRPRSHNHVANLAHLYRAIDQCDPHPNADGFAKCTVDMGEIVGASDCVRTYNLDAKRIKYIQREARDGVTRFVSGRRPTPTSKITLVLSYKGAYWLLITAFYGAGSEPEPWDERAFERDERGYEAAKAASDRFWSQHALILKP